MMETVSAIGRGVALAAALSALPVRPTRTASVGETRVVGRDRVSFIFVGRP